MLTLWTESMSEVRTNLNSLSVHYVQVKGDT
jgi:hypothetical protein